MTKRSPRVITRKMVRRQISLISDTLVLHLLALMIIRIGSRVLSARLPGSGGTFNNSIIELSGCILFYLITGCIMFPAVAKRLKLNIRDYQRVPKLTLEKWIGMVSLGVSIYLVATMFTSTISNIFVPNAAAYPSLGRFKSIVDIIDNVFYFLLFVLIKPTLDEYIFRGIIQRQFGHYGRYFGITGSALLYALCQNSLLSAIPAFALGWYISIMTLRYHSIVPGRRISIAAAFTMWLLEILPGNLIWLSTVLIMVIYAVAVISIVLKNVTTKMPKYKKTAKAVWKTFFTMPSVIFIAVIFIANAVLTIILNH